MEPEKPSIMNYPKTQAILRTRYRTIWFDWFDLLVFNATFNNIAAISWRSVLVVEEAGVSGENHQSRASTGKLYHLRLRVKCTLFCNVQSRAWTHAALVIGFYELLGNPTTYLIEPIGPWVRLEVSGINLW